MEPEILIRRAGAALLTVALAAPVAGCAALDDVADQASVSSGGERGRVVKVVDGDTLRVRIAGGRTQRIRMARIDAPEQSTTRYAHPECGGAEATEQLQRLVAGATVTLSRPSSEDTDRYGRLVREVTVDGRSVDEAMARGGWAKPYRVPTASGGAAANRRIARAAADARRHRRGVWALCGAFGKAL